MTDGVSGRFVSTRLAAWMQPFQPGFTAPTWQHVLVLIVGAILTPGRRTVAAALRVIGLDQDPHFTNYHRVLNRNQWSSRWLARCLLRLMIATFVPTGPVIVGLDDTIERRWGAKIKARGIYRDPVRSSRSHVVKASGLRWLSLMLLPQIPWAGRVWALPFLTVLAPSERYARERQQQYKKLTDWGRQMLLQLVRWLPERRIIAVTDASFAAIGLLNALRCRLCMITRLRLDARLFDP
ncbi:MAG: transposase, partial [Pseudolabrys sp.]